MGTGSSNSVISVLDEDTGQKIAEFADAFTTPEELAWQVAMAGVWFGGANGRPLLIWETNGPGSIFGKVSDGIDIVHKIAAVPVKASATGEMSVPTQVVQITTIEISEQ